MSNDPETRPEGGVVALMGGIITDVHMLIKQQLALFEHDIKGEVSHASEAGSLVAVGLSVIVMGGVLLGGMLVHFLAWVAPVLPLWGCYGIVGAPVAGLGAILCLVGIRKFKSFDTQSVEPAQELKEKV